MAYVERARSGRSICELCRQPIAKGSWRVGNADFYHGREYYHWYHPECYLKENRGGNHKGLIKDFFKAFIPLFFDEDTAATLLITLEFLEGATWVSY